MAPASGAAGAAAAVPAPTPEGEGHPGQQRSEHAAAVHGEASPRRRTTEARVTAYLGRPPGAALRSHHVHRHVPAAICARTAAAVWAVAAAYSRTDRRVLVSPSASVHLRRYLVMPVLHFYPA